MTHRPWPPGTRPTPAQLLEYLRDDRLDTDDALLLVDKLLRLADDGGQCLMLDHDSLGRELDHMRRNLYTTLIDANRYRLAWTNARRRAAYYRRQGHALITRLDRVRTVADDYDLPAHIADRIRTALEEPNDDR